MKLSMPECEMRDLVIRIKIKGGDGRMYQKASDAEGRRFLQSPRVCVQTAWAVVHHGSLDNF